MRTRFIFAILIFFSTLTHARVNPSNLVASCEMLNGGQLEVEFRSSNGGNYSFFQTTEEHGRVPGFAAYLEDRSFRFKKTKDELVIGDRETGFALPVNPFDLTQWQLPFFYDIRMLKIDLKSGTGTYSVKSNEGTSQRKKIELENCEVNLENTHREMKRTIHHQRD